MELPQREQSRSVNIAPRKLTRQNEQMITNSWQGALSSGAGPRTSLKIEGQSASGVGSSLVVNLRGFAAPRMNPPPPLGRVPRPAPTMSCCT